MNIFDSFIYILLTVLVSVVGLVAGLFFDTKHKLTLVVIIASVITLHIVVFKTFIEPDIEKTAYEKFNQQELVDNFYKMEPGQYDIIEYRGPEWYPLMKDSLFFITLKNGTDLLVPTKKMKLEFYEGERTTHEYIEGQHVVTVKPNIDSLIVKTYEIEPLVFQNFAIIKLLE